MGMPRRGLPASGIYDDAVAEVLPLLAESLRARGSQLALGEALDPGLEVQVRSILREAIESARGGDDAMGGEVSVDYSAPAALESHGRGAGIRNVDPAEPLMAAEILFHHALPVVVRLLDDRAPDPVRVARALHRAIWRRFPPGAIAYVNVLRDRLASAHADSRKRVARELHDRLGQQLTVARQRAELLVRAPTAEAAGEVFAAIDESIREVQTLAFDLRQEVGALRLEQALGAYVAQTPGHPMVFYVRAGTERPLPSAVAEELLAVAIELIRNARRHALDATTIQLVLTWGASDVILEVRDDGHGSRADSGGSSLGMVGISERAGAIGGEFSVASGNDGTRATVRVPHIVPQRVER